MNIQTIIDFILGFLLTCLGWFARELWAAVKELKADLAKLREEIPTKYVQKDEHREDMREIKEMFRQISEKLDKKADK